MRFPVRPKHLPTPRNDTLRSNFHLARPVGIGTNQMCAAHETRRHPPVGKTVQLRVTAPYKDMIARARPLDDLLNNREKIELLRPCRESHDEKTYRRHGGRADNARSDPSPAQLRRMSLFRDKARERLARENRQRRKHCQMIMSRKSPSNKDRKVGEAEPQNKQNRLGGDRLPPPKRPERFNHLPDAKIPQQTR